MTLEDFMKEVTSVNIDGIDFSAVDKSIALAEGDVCIVFAKDKWPAIRDELDCLYEQEDKQND